MRIFGQKIEPDKLAQIAKAQDRAFELVKTHLAGPLERIEALGYNRIELACAYLTLAYHALRSGRTKEQADRSFHVLAHLARQRMEHNFEQRKKKLH